MSEAFLATLPRFDTDAPAPSSNARRILLRQESATEPEPEKPEIVLTPETEPEPEVQPLVHPDFADVEIVMAALSDTIERLEIESRQQTIKMTQAIAARLFPELSRSFLAHEIGRHLGAMVPSNAPAVEIRAQSLLADKLSELVAASPSLSERCAVLTASPEESSRVEVSWETGGVTFDFDGLLTACLAQLDFPQSPIKE
ncbi:MAG: hypothetical protein KJ871_14040 [Alphaproteobacteria bacterium]|nr:hypothetical protein [Alphaproteobacteria bacterium]MBU2085468.1 hypothetical protein [Alphaproteobacteria bacterium]MBU2143464.1 hypothetical protein [Alphaproteobacteria bacterium]MBU2196111.1 hypothetical protein [Alphaproteobacteria bacterium]